MNYFILEISSRFRMVSQTSLSFDKAEMIQEKTRMV